MLANPKRGPMPNKPITLSQRVRGVIAEVLRIPSEEVFESSDLKEDLLLDDLEFAQLIMALEEDFEVEFTDNCLKKMVLVGDCVDLVRTKLDEETTQVTALEASLRPE
jgi:acyl carrier protein